MPPVGGPVKGSAVVSTGQGGAPNAEGKNPWETGEPGHWGDDGKWVSEVGGAGGQAAPEAAGQAAPEAALQAAPEEAVPPAKLALSCEATSPQASADWCVTSCGEDPENNGCKQFCKCEAMGETSEASEASEASETSETSEASEASEASETSEASEASETSETSEASEASEALSASPASAADAALREAIEAGTLEGIVDAIHANADNASPDVLEEARAVRDELRDGKAAKNETDAPGAKNETEAPTNPSSHASAASGVDLAQFMNTVWR